MNVICIEDVAFNMLVDKVADRIANKLISNERKWISANDAMRILGIKSKTTLQSLRDEGKIRFSQPAKKIILYDLDSLNNYLEKHAKDTF